MFNTGFWTQASQLKNFFKRKRSGDSINLPLNPSSYKSAKVSKYQSPRQKRSAPITYAINMIEFEGLKECFFESSDVYGHSTLWRIVKQLEQRKNVDISPQSYETFLKILSQLCQGFDRTEFITWDRFIELLINRSYLQIPIQITTNILNERESYFETLVERGVETKQNMDAMADSAKQQLNQLQISKIRTQSLYHRIKNSLATSTTTTTTAMTTTTPAAAVIVSAATDKNDTNKHELIVQPDITKALSPELPLISLTTYDNIYSQSTISTNSGMTTNHSQSSTSSTLSSISRIQKANYILSKQQQQQQLLEKIQEIDNKMKIPYTIPAIVEYQESFEVEKEEEEVAEHEEGLEEIDLITTSLIEARFYEINKNEFMIYKNTLKATQPNRVVIEKFSIDMTEQKLSCLRACSWLNDEIINYYMELLLARDTLLCEQFPTRKKSHFFNSFFMNKLIDCGGYNYNNVRRWTRKINIFEKDKIFCPINLNNTHWTLSVIYMSKKEIHYYDSMNGSGEKYLQGLKQYIQDECNDKYKGKIELNIIEWKLINREAHVPQQMNGYDCGVFTIICADFLSDDLRLSYSQQDMSFFRDKIGTDILRGELLYPLETIRLS